MAGLISPFFSFSGGIPGVWGFGRAGVVVDLITA